MKKITIITPNQCKAARDLLEWKQTDLAKNSTIGISTITEFERGLRELAARTMKELVRTFEEVGVEFINDDKGLGVKLLNDKK